MAAFFKNRVFVARGFALVLFLCVGLFAFHAPAYATSGCGFGDVGCELANFLGAGLMKVIATIFAGIAGIAAICLGWAASFFNFAMLVTVYQFANFFGNSDGLRLAWGILRDLANILLLFGFIFIGVTTILDVDSPVSKKTLPMLIIVAILLNFSLFVAEAVVDMSNAVASTFYAQAGDADCSKTENDLACANLGIAGKVMEISGIVPIFDVGDQVSTIWSDDGGPPVMKAVIHFGLLVLIIVMIGTFLAGAFILVSRAITLVFLFITAPIGFAGLAIPVLHKYAEDWWKKLIDNAIFAPVYVLFMLISIKLIEGVRNSFLPQGGAPQSIYTILTESNPLSIGGIFILFALVAGFMGASLIWAKQSGVMFADKAADGALKWIGNTVGSFTTAPLAWGAKGLGHAYSGGLRGLRRFPLLGKPLASVAGALGGAALDRGIRDTLKAGEGLKIPGVGAQTIGELREERKKRADELNALDKTDKEKIDLGKKQMDLHAAIKTAKKGNADDLEKVVNSMNVKQIQDTMKGAGASDTAEMAKAMSAAKFKQVLEDKETSDGAKKNLKDARFGEMKRLIKEAADTRNTGSDAARSELARWSTSDFEMSGVLDPNTKDPELRAQAVRVMSDSQYEGIQKGGVDTLGRNAKRDIKNLREDPDTSGSRFHHDHIDETFATVVKKPNERAQLSGKVLAAAVAHTRPLLRPEDFRAIQKADKLEATDKAVMVTYVRRLHTGGDVDLLDYLTNLGPRDRNAFRNYYGV